MSKITILWADDEIDLLKPQIMFLEKKDYKIIQVSNGHDAIDECKENPDIDVIFLDESMPGLTGLETLEKIRAFKTLTPIVMITKNEAENVMEEAIGAQITDYLIKPVNPNQILLTLKKIIDNTRLVKEKVTTDYQQEFRNISMRIGDRLDIPEWVDVYKNIIKWEMKMDASKSKQMGEILSMQKTEANKTFSKFVENNYLDWLDSTNPDSPTMSYNLLRKKVFPKLDDTPTFFLLLDNLRYDQWIVLKPIISELFKIQEEDNFFSILPTTTQYSRNSIFAGLMPEDINQYYPTWWKNDIDEGGKNLHEHDLLGEQIGRLIKRPIKFDYTKITTIAKAKNLNDTILNYLHNDLTVIVYNFIDMLSHARTEMEVLKELAGDEAAYRSLTKSWFLHSPLWSALQKIAEKDVRLIIGTDHGTIRVNTPSKVVGDKDTTTNLRYKTGKNLKYSNKDVLAIRDPKKAGLPKTNMSSSFIFAKEDKYFLYPNNYNHYNNYYRNTFQHGGISMEEIICPIIELRSK